MVLSPRYYVGCLVDSWQTKAAGRKVFLLTLQEPKWGYSLDEAAGQMDSQFSFTIYLENAGIEWEGTLILCDINGSFMYLNQDLSLFCSEDLSFFLPLQEIPFRREKIIAKTVSKITFRDVRAPWAVKQIEPGVLIGLTTFEQIIPSDASPLLLFRWSETKQNAKNLQCSKPEFEFLAGCLLAINSVGIFV